jgi:hypothetical protein
LPDKLSGLGFTSGLGLADEGIEDRPPALPLVDDAWKLVGLGIGRETSFWGKPAKYPFSVESLKGSGWKFEF